MTVETRELVSLKEGLLMCSRSTAILFSAVLSRTTTASAFSVSRLSVSSELYGCTTTSLAAVSFWFGKTLRACKICQRSVIGGGQCVLLNVFPMCTMQDIKSQWRNNHRCSAECKQLYHDAFTRSPRRFHSDRPVGIPCSSPCHTATSLDPSAADEDITR